MMLLSIDTKEFAASECAMQTSWKLRRPFTLLAPGKRDGEYKSVATANSSWTRSH